MSKKVLVVVDMQNDFIDGPLGNAECQAVVPKVVDVIKNGEWDEIITTHDTHDEKYMNIQEGKNLPIPHCIFPSNGWALIPEVRDAIEEKSDASINFDKHTFGSIHLSEYLYHKYFSYGNDVEITFVGVCTGICVISNAVIAKSFCPEAKINIVADACACVTPESHKTALEAMKLLQMNII